MNALLKHPHLDVEIFEFAPEFSERGAAVGIAQNGQAALAEIGGAVAGALDRAGAVVMSSSRMYMASGPSAMSFVFDLAAEQRGKVVHRAALLTELLKPISQEKMHTNKKVVRIEDLESGRVLLYFNDGATFEVDAVIGADGVHGYVREYVLGVDHPALKPKFGGFWDARSLVSMQKAKELLGKDYFNEGLQRQYGWVGDGGFFMHDVLDGGETVQCVVCGVMDEEWGEDEWKRELDRRALEKAVVKWTDTPIKRGMIEAMLENADLKAFAEWHHKENAPTYAKGHVCIMGDAAHCMTPWQGSGAGQAIEDAMILETLLKEVRDPSQLTAAFKAYDQVRRPRTQRIIKSSHGTGMIMCGRGPDTGLDMDKIREALPKRWVFIHTQDQKEHKRESLAALKAVA
ncbi:FAD/NAD(P)-binding domain-containing protein [Zopfia rhizophila CBS 207.26]|uniref:FAD/NAD(P)-binding domain-containing protein n=1 Tax=Zopfia rhizophila CBS 207.26 TaxID=1314779 RepID=A0A6A6ES71_9PEZI|nr:FAD/NAD(P)-binding domain-containing protein [Zopfia rhizophila CBS 207.26]